MNEQSMQTIQRMRERLQDFRVAATRRARFKQNTVPESRYALGYRHALDQFNVESLLDIIIAQRGVIGKLREQLVQGDVKLAAAADSLWEVRNMARDAYVAATTRGQ